MNLDTMTTSDAAITGRNDDLQAQLEAIKAKLRAIEEHLEIAR